ncbi:MAG: sulfurtransferase TusA family protein [Armatimonadota bacterium]|jgi:tRNA 2-thiouridine synthesizing protein A
MNEAIEIDVRGLSCPEPVLHAKQAMQQKDATIVHVLVDSNTTRDNVKRAAEMENWNVRQTQLDNGEFRLELVK